jgi:hypothetical protein
MSNENPFLMRSPDQLAYVGCKTGLVNTIHTIRDELTQFTATLVLPRNCEGIERGLPDQTLIIPAITDLVENTAIGFFQECQTCPATRKLICKSYRQYVGCILRRVDSTILK